MGGEFNLRVKSDSHFICHTCGVEFLAEFDHSRGIFGPGFVEDHSKKVVVCENQDSHSKECPFCKHSIKDINTECSYCLRIPSKFREWKDFGALESIESLGCLESKKSASDPIQIRLNESWQEVLENFENSKSHQEFIELCQKLNQLIFAENHYRRLRELLGEDTEVDKRIHQIEILKFNKSSIGMTTTEKLQNQEIRNLRFRLIFGIVGVLLFLIGGLTPHVRYFSFIGIFIIAGLFLNSIKK